ncbi:MAG: hypothetical protein AAGD13_02325 [Pseudomonadota bacterium]
MSNMSTRSDGISFDSMSATDIIDEAMRVLSREREIFLTGAYELLEELTAKKTRILQALEVTLQGAVRTAEIVIAVRGLIDASRRNEMIIQAAMQGIAQARRRLASIAKMRRGAVAYAEDGTVIASRADALGGGKIA